MERPPASSPAGARPRARIHVAPSVVLVTGLACAVAAASYVGRVVHAQEETRFRQYTSASIDALRDRMEAYVGMLRAARGLLAGLGDDPDPAAFRRFVTSLDVPRHYPGIQGIGWAKALRPGEIAAHEARERRAHGEGYRVWPPGPRHLYSAIVLLEPLDWRNERAVGYDMHSEPIRREAMDRARDTGEVTASGKVELVQETATERQPGFLMYLPVYARPPRTPAERRQLLRGWVYAPFRAHDLLSGTLGEDEPGSLGVFVYDGPDPRPAALLWGAAPMPGAAERRRIEHVTVAGRPWTLEYAATAAFASRTERALPGLVLAAGAAVALLLFLVTRADARARARAERAAIRASFLAEAGELLASSTRFEQTIPRVAGLAARRVVEACLVAVVDGQAATWFVGDGDPERSRRALEALRGARPDAPGAADALGTAAALRSGEPQLRMRIGGAGPPGSARAAAVASALGVAATLAIPLAGREAAVGVLVLAWRRGHAPSDEDLQLGADLARLLASSVETARLYRRAQEAVAARDEFLSIASHELKTPLTSLVLHTDSLRAVVARGALQQVTGKAELIRRSADRLARLVASLLDISRISAGRLDLELEDTDLAEVVLEVAARFEDEARRTGSALAVRAEGPIPGRWDRMRLDQVVTNLLSNALKYGPGQPIEVEASAEGGRAVLTVRDHGIGISVADQRRIFQRFERAVSRRNYGGFGLGLWIVRQIVEALGGSVRVESAPGLGSTFTVELRSTHRAAPPGDEARAPSPPP